jgi:protocatechuate 3,4-dioxygenase beta subunit
MRTKLPLVVLAVLVLAGGLLWTFGGNTSGAAAELEDGAATLESTASARPSGSDASGAGDEVHDDASRDAVASESAELLASNRLAPTGIEIRPVVGAERRNVEGVELWWIETEDSETPWSLAECEKWLDSGVLEERMAERAERIERDAAGRWRLPKPAQIGAVVASAEGLWAFAAIARTSTDPTYVTLERDLTLTARVVDLAGKPVEGVQVALRQDCGEDCTIDHAVVTTDADGIARFRHYRALIDGDWDYNARYGFSIAEPLATPVRKEFELTAPPGELVTLELPPTGSVVLRFSAESKVELARLELRESGDEVDPEGGEPRRFDGEREVREGSVRFPFVGLGNDVIPFVLDGERVRVLESARAPGPARAGQEVTLELETRASGVTVTGRALDEAGQPQAGMRCLVYLDSHDPDSDDFVDGIWSRTDAQGRFEIAYDRRATGPSQVEFLLADDGLEVTGKIEHKFDWPANALEHDVGDLRVAPLPILLEGRVVDGQGRAVAGARITTWVRSAQGSGGIRRSQWTQEGDSRLRSGADGRFVLRSAEKFDEFMLVARADGACSSPTRARSGERDVTLVVDHDGVLRGRLEFDENVSSDHLDIEVEPEAPEDPTRPMERDFWASVDPDGRFVVRGVRAGLYSVRVHLAGVDRPVTTVKGVRVEAGSERVDPRLDPLDLRKLGRWRNVRVLEPDGTPAREWTTKRVDPLDPDEFDFDWGGGPWLRLSTNEPPLWLGTESSLFERVDPLTVGDTIRLSPAPRVRLVVSPDCRWPTDASLEVSVMPVHGDDRFAEYVDDVWRELEQGQPFELLAHELGALEVNLWLYARNNAELPCEIVRGGVLAATSGVHVLEIRWTQEALDKALAQARE